MKSFIIAALLPLVQSAAYIIPSSSSKTVSPPANNRRAILQQSIAGLAAALTLPRSATASDLQDVYFGAGCFWHVQHEFVLAERNLLNRKDSELTSRTGYAGGFKTDDEGRVCYHNFQGVADYGKLGHGEVVGMTIPEDKVGDFAVEYFKLFGDKGERADPMDKGGEYRSLLGLPGGTKHPQYQLVQAAGEARGMILKDGKGNDPDTLGKRIVYVMDSNKFPFYQAEVYHQYHNDFLTPAYGKEYNNLVNAAVEDGRIKNTGCPDRMSKLLKQVQNTSELGLSSAAAVITILCVLIWKARKKLGYSTIDQSDKDSDIVEDDDDDAIGKTEMTSA